MKLPKHKKASDCLRREIEVLRGLEHKSPLEIPNVLFEGRFPVQNQEYVFFGSKRLAGKKLSKLQFLSLSQETTARNGRRIAGFLYWLHHERQVLPIRRRDFALLHGDFSLDHILFNEENIVSGVLDFGDSRVGKPLSDFVYLLDDQDEEEFGGAFGRLVLAEYERCAHPAV